MLAVEGALDVRDLSSFAINVCYCQHNVDFHRLPAQRNIWKIQYFLVWIFFKIFNKYTSVYILLLFEFIASNDF